MKLIYDTINEILLPWPRIDDEPVIGLEPHLLEMTVVQEDAPDYNPVTEVLEQTQVIDSEAKTVTRSWNVVDLPPTLYSAEEWLNAISPIAGQIYFSSGDNHFYGYNGTEWKQLDN